MLTEEETVEETERRPRLSRSEFRNRIKVVSIVAAVMIVMDYVSLRWFVPWADEMTTNRIMSLGFIVALFVTFCNFIVFVALLAYVLSEESYASERWE